MTTFPERTEPGIARRALATLLATIVLLLVSGYAAVASVALGKTWLTQSRALLALPAKPTSAIDALSDATIRTAFAAAPLEQRTVNIAMVREARARPAGQDRTLAWLPVLKRLGWRDTPALQNLLYAAGLTQDLPEVLDASDALLRRQKLTDQIIPVMALVEASPRLQGAFAARLAGNPSWRALYLISTGPIGNREQLLARFALIRRLRRDGVRLDPGEVTPSIILLDQRDLSAYGFALWHDIRPEATRPLDDVDFRLASQSYQSKSELVPYQWQLMTGNGFTADALNDGGRARLSIDWNGRGVPVFAQQRTSAAPGRYALSVGVSPDDIADLAAIAFRMTCGGVAVAFVPAGPTRYVTAAAVPCAYPVLQIAGDVQASATPHQLAINHILLTPLAAGSR